MDLALDCDYRYSDCDYCYGECVCPGSYAAALTNGHAAEGLEDWADLL